MEARLLILLAAVVLIRLPFLDQAVQGDDVYYLAIARNALADPLHPMQTGYVFQGAQVSMAGHPHPPLNAYVLALLMRIFGGVREAAFHACYLVFSLVAVAAMYALGRRFTERPLLAAALFAAVPAFLVNGNTFEADLPFLAFWMAGFALYFAGQDLPAAASLALAALGAYQGIFAAPILAHHVWHHRRRSRTAWIAVAAAPAALAAWQLFQRFTAGEAPAGVLAGYLWEFGMLGLKKKLASAVALTAHIGWPALPAGALVGAWWANGLLVLCLATGIVGLLWWLIVVFKWRSQDDGFLAAWGLAFFGGALLVFYAGSARYLLPLAPAVALTLVRMMQPWILWPVVAGNLAVGLLLAFTNYHHADEYRRFARDLKPAIGERRLWSNAEWGLRYYLEEIGGEPLLRGQPVYPGSVVVTSELARGAVLSSGGARRQPLARRELSSRWARLIGLGSRSGYSSSDLGLLPFEPGGGLLDRVKAEVVGGAEPRLSYLRMSDPDAAEQLLAGFYAVENNAWRWMGEQGVVLLKVPPQASRFEMTFFIPDAAPARRLTVAIDGSAIASQAYAAPGRFTLSAALRPQQAAAQVVISVDKTFRPPQDSRTLGVIVQELGWRE